jgi:hypothetical protein
VRIGRKRAEYGDAVTLAEIAAMDLRRYGYSCGEVLTMWNTSVLKSLRIVPAPAHHDALLIAPMLQGHAVLHREVARLVLEDLRQLSRDADPTLAAPLDWIARLESVLRIIATPADQRRYRIDGLHNVTTDYLHRRAAAVLQQFDRLVAASKPLPVAPGDERHLTV